MKFSSLFTAKASERDDGYSVVEQMIRNRVAAVSQPLFTTDVQSLYADYVGNLPEQRRSHYRCRACQDFVRCYGGLVTIDEQGEATPVMWDPIGVPSFFAASFAAVDREVRRASVSGVFYSSEEVWGRPLTKTEKSPDGYFTHLAARSPAVFSHPIRTAEQAMAEKREDFKMLRRALLEYRLPVVREAVRVLEAAVLTRSEKALSIARWFLALHESLTNVRDRRLRDNLVWKAVAAAPLGFSHINSTMISTLLDDIVVGMDFSTVAARWAKKMHPLQYQRPSAPLKDGAIRAAEEVVAGLRSAGALDRRFARLDEVVALWGPRPEAGLKEGVSGSSTGVFSHLHRAPTSTVKPLELPAKTLTWVRFAAEVLPDADSIDLLVPAGRAPFYGLVTAKDPAAPPILQWDAPLPLTKRVGYESLPPMAVEEPLLRNPVSWYFHAHGSTAAEFNLTPGWTSVTAIFHEPPSWYSDQFTHFSPIAFLALAGCRDRKRETQKGLGGGFFPEILRAEYHGVRSVLEAYAKKAEITGADEGNANGIAFQSSSPPPCPFELRVRSRGGVSLYRVDRWE